MMMYFFFHAEDGIRDATVTGVQTCALPISHLRQRHGGEQRAVLDAPRRRPRSRGRAGAAGPLEHRAARHMRVPLRSEERRVGKEWRTRWGAERLKNRDAGGRCSGGVEVRES